MADATFTTNSTSGTSVAVSPGATVTLAQVDTAGASLREWSIIGSSDSALTNPTITPGSPTTSATFTMDSSKGVGYLVQLKVNGGVDASGQRVTSQTYVVKVHTVDENGKAPYCVGEEFEEDATHGYTASQNNTRRGLGTRYPTTGHTQTTTTGATTLATIAVQDESTLGMTVVFRGWLSGGTDRYLRTMQVTYQRKSAGAPTEMVGKGDVHAIVNDGTWVGGDTTVSSNNILVQVEGAAATTINWSAWVYLWEELHP